MAAGFDYQKRLGRGYFGEVWKVTDLGLNCTRALKIIPKDKVFNQRNFFAEAQALKAAEHANIVSVYETGNHDKDRIYVSMEYLEKGSVEDEFQGGYLPLSRAKQILIDVLRGLNHAHNCDVLHRDIKPANILVGAASEGKLSDFGLAVKDMSSLDLTAVKEYQYFIHLAPEVRSFDSYSKLADVYACGVTLYRLVNGDSYLPSIPLRQAIRLARRGEFPNRDNYRNFVPLSMRRLINKAISVDPKDRFQSADEMRRSLEQVLAAVDWQESKLKNGYVWKGTKGDMRLRLRVYETLPGSWSLLLEKGRKSLRRDSNHTLYGLTEHRAQREACKILQAYVNDKA